MEKIEKIPNKIFIVPYRNRTQHKFFFTKYMSYLLEDDNDYEIYFSHQCDPRTFNRGAVKNIGFMAMKQKYPNHYQNITFIFNDVDTIPFYKIFDYDTTHGIVKHHYGFKYALGGIVVIKGSDFEKINGFPCYWGWGMEDNVLQKRCEAHDIYIDRSVFYKIGSPEILQLFDGISRIISKNDPLRGENDDGVDGIQTIKGLKYTIDDVSDNPSDNIFVFHNSKIKIINIKTFSTHVPFGSEEYYNYDLREPKEKIIQPDKIKETKKSVVHTDEWSDIPHYPTSRERRKQLAEHLLKTGQHIPTELLQQIAQDNENELLEDHFNIHFQQFQKKHSNAHPNLTIINQPVSQFHRQPPQPPQLYYNRSVHEPNHGNRIYKKSPNLRIGLGGIY
jgi:hypothetical protein